MIDRTKVWESLWNLPFPSFLWPASHWHKRKRHFTISACQHVFLNQGFWKMGLCLRHDQSTSLYIVATYGIGRLEANWPLLARRQLLRVPRKNTKWWRSCLLDVWFSLSWFFFLSFVSCVLDFELVGGLHIMYCALKMLGTSQVLRHGNSETRTSVNNRSQQCPVISVWGGKQHGACMLLIFFSPLL